MPLIENYKVVEFLVKIPYTNVIIASCRQGFYDGSSLEKNL